MCVCWPRDDDLVDAEGPELLVQARAVEGAVGALGRDDLARRPARLQLGDDAERPGCRPSACSPHTRSSGSDGSCASFEKTTTQSSSAASMRRAGARAARRSARGMRVGESAGDEVVEHVDDHEGLHAGRVDRAISMAPVSPRKRRRLTEAELADVRKRAHRYLTSPKTPRREAQGLWLLGDGEPGRRGPRLGSRPRRVARGPRAHRPLPARAGRLRTGARDRA